jgi:hypothetical protein
MMETDNRQELPAGCCCHLRCKQMYYEGRRPMVTDTTVFWCVKTLYQLGPDREPVDPDLCRPGRTCFEVEP